MRPYDRPFLQSLRLLSAPTRELTAILTSGRDIERCGLLAGTLHQDAEEGLVERVIGLTNASETRGHFDVHVEELIAVRDEIDDSDVRVLSFYHSHPSGCTNPSFADLALPRLLGLACVIFALLPSGGVQVAGYDYVGGAIVPIDVKLTARLRTVC